MDDQSFHGFHEKVQLDIVLNDQYILTDSEDSNPKIQKLNESKYERSYKFVIKKLGNRIMNQLQDCYKPLLA